MNDDVTLILAGAHPLATEILGKVDLERTSLNTGNRYRPMFLGDLTPGVVGSPLFDSERNPFRKFGRWANVSESLVRLRTFLHLPLPRTPMIMKRLYLMCVSTLYSSVIMLFMHCYVQYDTKPCEHVTPADYGTRLADSF